jgi:hypothetical protein
MTPTNQTRLVNAELSDLFGAMLRDPASLPSMDTELMDAAPALRARFPEMWSICIDVTMASEWETWTAWDFYDWAAYLIASNE